MDLTRYIAFHHAKTGEIGIFQKGDREINFLIVIIHSTVDALNEPSLKNYFIKSVYGVISI